MKLKSGQRVWLTYDDGVYRSAEVLTASVNGRVDQVRLKVFTNNGGWIEVVESTRSPRIRTKDPRDVI